MRIAYYEGAHGREAMLRFGPDSGPIAIVALPLFEEANRMRAFAVTLCRALADRGFASLLPDLPGQGDSCVPLEHCSLLDIADGIARASQRDRDCGRALYGVSMRSGAILDTLGLFNGRWHFAPQDAPGLLRDLKRIRRTALGSEESPGTDWYFDTETPNDAPAPPVEIAGNLISTKFLADLMVNVREQPDDVGHRRIIRLDTDPKPADRKVSGAPLWRRIEPDNDPALATLLADDIIGWIATCDG